MAPLKFATFSSEIEMPFYSALFSSKLEHDKLDDSARPVLGLYEYRAHADAASSTKMQILASALTSDQQVPLCSWSLLLVRGCLLTLRQGAPWVESR